MRKSLFLRHYFPCHYMKITPINFFDKVTIIVGVGVALLARYF
ncbi:hypothetical protein COXBURSA334_1133 [Coxiella burnetii Q321]|nr:hypothetical protein COXBURSA334_1133 [Coxiella burnetii Q321]